MGAVFVKILNMSLTAGWIVLAVLLVRLIFKKKAPKALFPILWALVAVRLICPVTFESSFSLIRNPEPVAGEVLASDEEKTIEPPTFPENTDPETVKQFAKDYEDYINSLNNTPEKVMVSVMSIPTDTEKSDGIVYFDEIDPEETKLPDKIMEELENHGSYTEITEEGVTNTYTLISQAMQKEHKPSVYGILGIIWISGAVAMLLYMLFSYLRVYRKVKESALYEKNVRRCDSIDSPFILGVIRPKIYLPSDISESDRDYVLAHERAHLKRLDHIWKPLGFLLLSVYWYHPLLWVAYILLCKDIEFACDEKVIKELGVDQKKAYSTALINCSVSRKMISACPLAFGENGVKGRIKSVLHYKKPAFWIVLISVMVCVVIAICFLTNPKEKEEQREVTTTPEVTMTPELTSVPDKTEEKKTSQNKVSVLGDLTEIIETTNLSIAIGDEYAAYLDEDGKAHVLYDTSYRSDNDTVGATGGIDTSKTYKALGTDPYRLVAIDEDGKLSVSYHMTSEELTEYCNQVAKDAADNGGTYGLGGPQSWIAKDFEELSEVRQVFSTYPYSGYTALCDDGYVYPRSKWTEPFADIVQIAEANGHIMGLKADGTLVMTEVSDVLRKKKLDTWPEKLKQIAAGYNFFVGLKLDGTVISEGVEQEYMINSIEKWSGIVKIAVANETVVGLKGDGTVVAVCPARSDKGQCEVDDWTNVIAVNTNGSVTIGITKDGTVLMVGDVPEIVKNLPERYNYEEIKSVFLEYLNHQAWLYPSQYPQESYSCTYELFCSVTDTKTKYVYLKTVINGTERWIEFKPEKYYVATSPTRIVEQRTDIMKESVANGGIVSIGTDELYVPAVTKPAYGNPVDVTGDISSIYAELKRNGYRENLKLEVIVSEHDLEKNLYPYVYLIINDSEVFETSFGELEGNSIGLYSLPQMFFYGNYSKDYTIEYGDGWSDVFDGHSIKPLDSVDAEQFERVKACAVFRQIVKGNNTESILIDGETVEIESSNLGINEALGVRIAFLPQWGMAGSVHYNIYRSDDRGNSWRMIAEDFSKESGDIARILIPEKDTVVCWFEISGTTSQSSCMVSEDGGVTWKHAPYASKPNAFTYDPQKDTSVIFGAYEQDGDYSNGKEPLEWLVLDRDGDRALLLSKYGIETLLWDKDQVLEEWDVDDLYQMMSRTIYEDAFSAEERAALIRMNPIENASLSYPNERILYPGYTFLLETDDVLYGQGQDETKYFRTEESRITIPTAYAAEKGAWLDKNVMFTDVAVPWIVTVTGTTDNDFSEVQFARVMPDGSISFEEEAIKEQHVLIRPAIWVDVTKLPKPDWM